MCVFDVCFVSYCSEKWVDGCLKAFSRVQYDKKKISLYFADNQSTDGTLNALERGKQQYAEQFAGFHILAQKENRGFGAGSNAAAREGTGEYIFFCNLDTEIHEDAFVHLEQAIRSAGQDVAAFELRQFPYEHPKCYDPVTMEVSWASGACMVVRRDVWKKTGGFDENIFMYAEDVDLSWQIRALGYRIQYVPAAVITHFCYESAGQEKPGQVVGSLVGNLFLRQKYGTLHEIEGWEAVREILQPKLSANPDAWALYRRCLADTKKQRCYYRHFYETHIQPTSFRPQFIGTEYEEARGGAFFCCRKPKQTPLVTVLVQQMPVPRLAETLENLTHQTYQHFQVLLPCSMQAQAYRTPIEQFQQKLKLELSCADRLSDMVQELDTEYFCCLSGELLFAEHLETVACAMEETPDYRCYTTDYRYFSEGEKRWIDSFYAPQAGRAAQFFCTPPYPLGAVMFRQGAMSAAHMAALEQGDATRLWALILSGEKAFVHCAKTTVLCPMRDEEKLRQMQHETALRASVNEILTSATWRVCTPVRLMLYSALPQPVDAQKDSVQVLEAFVQDVQASRCWNAVKKLRK